MISFELSEEQVMMRDMARDFARDRIRPLANQYYRHGKDVPHEALEELAAEANELRLLDYNFAEEWGGLGVKDKLVPVLINEELSWGDSGMLVHLVASLLAAKAVEQMGTPDQVKQWLGLLCNPDNKREVPKRSAFCLTEPDAGSAVTELSTFAKKVGDDYVLNGSKQFITNGGIADYWVVIAQTDSEASSPQEKAMGLAGFIVPKGTKGVTVGEEYEKWGVRASNTTPVMFDDCRIPKACRLGEEGPGGMLGVYGTLEATRIGVAAASLGIARAAFEASVAYAKTRVQKKPLIQFQAISHKIADMETEIQSARMITWRAAWMADRGIELKRGEGSQAKLKAGDVAVQTCLDAVQIHGGYGFIKEYDVGRWLNDSLVWRIWEGTAEIQRNTIARYLTELEEV